MSRITRKAKRLIPKSEIEWLTHDQRADHRKTLKYFSSLIEQMDDAKILSEADQTFLQRFTGSGNPETWYAACIDAYDKSEAAYLGKLARMGQHDLTAYHEFMNPDQPPAMHHRWLCEKLMRVEAGELFTLLISLSPGAAKSTYGSRSFVQWCMGRNPDWCVLGAGHSQKFTDNEFSKPNRDIINSENFRVVFPDIFLSENDQSADYWKLDGFKGKYYSKGAGAGIAGIRALLTNIDDPIRSAEDAASPTIREKQWRWMTSDVLSRRLPNARLVLIMTRWNSEDIAGHIEKVHNESPGAILGPVEIINIPAQAAADDPLGRKEGEWLWEEFYGAKHYESLRLTMPPSMWSALYMGIPLDKFGEYVSEDQFMRYENFPDNRGGKKDVRKTVISVDTAQKATKRSNPTAITIYRQGFNKIHYMVHAQKVKSKMDDVIKLLTRLATNWNADYILIEDAGFGSQILQNYQGKMPCPLVEFQGPGKSSKDFMFENAVTYITSGIVQFPKQAPWLADVVNEMVAFGSNGVGEDDYCDSFSQYTQHEIKAFRGGTKHLKVVG